MAQSTPKKDSLTIVREFVSNAKPLLDSLTALHFARLEMRVLYEQLERNARQRDEMAQGYMLAQQQLGRGSLAQLDLQQQLTSERKKRRQAQWRNVGLGALATYLLYRKLCPSCRY